jgi:Putative heme iron utilization protein
MHAPIADLRKKLAENPGVVFEDTAREHNITPRTLLEAMPESTRRFAPGAGFIEAMNDIATWGDITLIRAHRGRHHRVLGPDPQGRRGARLLQSHGPHRLSRTPAPAAPASRP